MPGIFALPRIAAFALVKCLIKVVALSNLLFVYLFIFYIHSTAGTILITSLVTDFHPPHTHLYDHKIHVLPFPVLTLLPFILIASSCLLIFFNSSWGFGNFCLSCVDTCHCWYLTARELGWRETRPQTQCKWSGLYFLSELMVLIEMTCKVISVLFCNVTTSAAGSQEGQAAQEITLMD